MAKGKTEQKKIYAYANWEALQEPLLIGVLFASPSRGKEIFSFEYDSNWLKSDFARDLDPQLKLFRGPQYPKSDHANFGFFLDSSPDRWGRTLMRRREEQLAREKKRASICVAPTLEILEKGSFRNQPCLGSLDMIGIG